MAAGGEVLDIVVVGAGLAGLAAGLAAQDAGLSVAVLESSGRAGGLARSVRQGGYTFDYSGHLLHLARPETRDLLFRVSPRAEWSELARRSLVLLGGRFVPYPFQLHLAYAPPEVCRECMAALPTAAPNLGDDPATVGFREWVYETLGAGIAAHFMIPYNEKLSGVGVDELTCEWLGRFVPSPPLEEIRRGGTSLRRLDTGYNASFLYPRAGGIDHMADALAVALEDLRLDARVVGINTAARQVRLQDGRKLGYRIGIVSAAPLAQMVRLVSPRLPSADRGGQLRATTVTCVNLGLRRINKRFEGIQWVYLPERRFAAYRMGFYKQFSPAMVPDGRESVYVEISHGPGVSVERLVDLAVSDILAAGVITARDEVELAVPLTMETAYVVHDRNAHPARTTLLAELLQRDVHMVGRYGRWEYASMEDAIWQGLEASNRMAGARRRVEAGESVG